MGSSDGPECNVARPNGRNRDTPLLAIGGITKRFPGVLANDEVSFDIGHGEIHALLGEMARANRPWSR